MTSMHNTIMKDENNNSQKGNITSLHTNYSNGSNHKNDYHSTYNNNNNNNDDDIITKLLNDATQELIDKMDNAFLEFQKDVVDPCDDNGNNDAVVVIDDDDDNVSTSSNCSSVENRNITSNSDHHHNKTSIGHNSNDTFEPIKNSIDKYQKDDHLDQTISNQVNDNNRQTIPSQEGKAEQQQQQHQQQQKVIENHNNYNLHHDNCIDQHKETNNIHCTEISRNHNTLKNGNLNESVCHSQVTQQLEQQNTDWDIDDNSFFAFSDDNNSYDDSNNVNIDSKNDYDNDVEEEEDNDNDEEKSISDNINSDDNSNNIDINSNNNYDNDAGKDKDEKEKSINEEVQQQVEKTTSFNESDKDENDNECHFYNEKNRPKPQDQPELEQYSYDVESECYNKNNNDRGKDNSVAVEEIHIDVDTVGVIEEKKAEELEEVKDYQQRHHESQLPVEEEEVQKLLQEDIDQEIQKSHVEYEHEEQQDGNESTAATKSSRNISTNNKTNTINNNVTSPSSHNSNDDEILRYMCINQSKTEELAESHAEDILSLTLEIQTLKDQLKKEQKEHENTKHYLNREEEKSVQLEMNIQTLQKEVQMMKERHVNDIEILVNEKEEMKRKVMEADEDAQQAFDLAKESDLKMTEMEILLGQALDEVEKLRSSHFMLPIISEQLSNDQMEVDVHNSLELSSDMDTTPRNNNLGVKSPLFSFGSPFNRDRAGIAMGRNILRQITDADDNVSSASASTLDGSTTSNTSSYLANLTRKSAEKRQRLRESMNRSVDGSTPNVKEVFCYSSSQSVQNSLDIKSESEKLMSTLKKVSDALKQSGKQLKLGGRWFSAPTSMTLKSKQQDNDEFNIESLTRHYCRSVEVLVSKQRDDVKELKNFCGYLEQRLQQK